VRQIKLSHVSFSAHVKIVHHAASCRTRPQVGKVTDILVTREMSCVPAVIMNADVTINDDKRS